MLGFFKKFTSASLFDRKVLRKNDISILILDERYNNLFANTDRDRGITIREERLRELMKEQARLVSESKEIAAKKKKCMERIMQLTTEVFENNNEDARREMQYCEREIKHINKKFPVIEKRLGCIPDSIRKANLQLLEYIVGTVYAKIKIKRKKAQKLERLIDKEKQSLKEAEQRLKTLTDEKENLMQDSGEIYSYFHDLLGGEELKKLDMNYGD